MRTTIDGAGRVVLPKAYRDRLGLRPHQQLEVQETASGILLVPVGSEPRVVEEPGGPVIVAFEDPDGKVPVLTDDMVRDLLESGRR